MRAREKSIEKKSTGWRPRGGLCFWLVALLVCCVLSWNRGLVESWYVGVWVVIRSFPINTWDPSFSEKDGWALQRRAQPKHFSNIPGASALCVVSALADSSGRSTLAQPLSGCVSACLLFAVVPVRVLDLVPVLAHRVPRRLEQPSGSNACPLGRAVTVLGTLYL